MGRFLEMVGWGGQLGGIQNQPGGFDEKRLVTLCSATQSSEVSQSFKIDFIFLNFAQEINFIVNVKQSCFVIRVSTQTP